MTCDKNCHPIKPYSRMAHCGACHHTFSGVSSFDAHRRGGACIEPAERGMAERDGVWRIPGDGKKWWT